MRLFYGMLSVFVLVFPFVRLYLGRSRSGVPNYFNVHNALILFVILCYLFSMLLHLAMPVFREHIEPVLTEISLMFLAGYPVYSSLNDPNIYSLFYGPNTYLLQAVFLKLFSNPIFAVKLYGVTCVLTGMLVIYLAVRRKYNNRIANLGLFYFSAIALLFGQVSFRNHADCTIFLGSSLAVASVFLPSSWLSMLMLSVGGALAINAKFHTAAFIFPLIILFYRQHGLKRLCISALMAVALIVLPFLHEQVSFNGFLNILSAYSNLWMHPLLFVHNFWMASTILLPVTYLFYVHLKTSKSTEAERDLTWTFLILYAMVIGVCILGSVDGAGLHHIAPFAPIFSVVLVIFYVNNSDKLAQFVADRSGLFKAVFMTTCIAWFSTMLIFSFSTQRAVVRFAIANHSQDVQQELLSIRDMLIDKGWQVLAGFTDHENHIYMYYRPLLWPVTKGNIIDPSVQAGRQVAGVKIPEATVEKFSNQTFDVVVLPVNGEPFSMDNWHDRSLQVFGDKLPAEFMKNYQPWKKYKYFVLWRAKRLG